MVEVQIFLFFFLDLYRFFHFLILFTFFFFSYLFFSLFPILFFLVLFPFFSFFQTIPFFCSKYIFDVLFFRIIPCVVFVLCSYNLIGYEHQYNSTDVNAPSFFNSSGCRGRVLRKGTCTTDPLANPPNNTDHGMFGRSKLILMSMLSIVAMSSAALTQTIASCTGNPMVTNFVSVLIILLMLMFSGALVSHVDMPAFVAWITSLSPFSFAFEALSIGQFQQQCFLFNPASVSSLFDKNGRKASVCVETSGYVWLLNFGCTMAANYTVDDGPMKCHYTNETIDRDISAALVLLCIYSLLGVVSLFFIRERR